MDSVAHKRHFSTYIFFRNAFCLDFLGPILKIRDILNLRKMKWSSRVCAICAWLLVWVEHVCTAACLSVSFCVHVCACVCTWLEILSTLYYIKAQKTQRLIRETYQTLALSAIDSLSMDPHDISCPEWVPLPTMLDFTPTHQKAWPFCTTTSNHFKQRKFNLTFPVTKEVSIPSRMGNGLKSFFICLYIICCPIRWHLHLSDRLSAVPPALLVPWTANGRLVQMDWCGLLKENTEVHQWCWD